MKVKALERCYFGQIREEGEEFEVPDDTEMRDAPFERVVEDEPKLKGKGKADDK